MDPPGIAALGNSRSISKFTKGFLKSPPCLGVRNGLECRGCADWNRRLRSRDWSLEQRPGHSNLYCKMSLGFQASPCSLPEKPEMGHAIPSHFTKWAYLKTLAEQPLKDEFPQFWKGLFVVLHLASRNPLPLLGTRLGTPWALWGLPHYKDLFLDDSEEWEEFEPEKTTATSQGFPETPSNIPGLPQGLPVFWTEHGVKRHALEGGQQGMVVLPEALLESQHGRHGVAQIGNPNIMGIEYV